MDIRITGIATANPPLKLLQKESLDILRKKRKLSRRENILYERFLLDKGIHSRYFSARTAEEFFCEDRDPLSTRFQEEAARLSIASAVKCLKSSTGASKEISCLAVSTCTGYLCPGLTSYVIEGARLRRDITALDLVGMGCGGAMPAIRACHDYLSSNSGTSAIALSTEISSAALLWDDDPELILSNSIFADGSAACLLTNRDGEKGFKILDFASGILPEEREKLRFRTDNLRLRNVIKPDVPAIAGRLVKETILRLFAKNGLEVSDVKFWAVHPGGRKVLDAIEKEVALEAGKLDFSRSILREYGNMSSPSVLYVLKEILQSKTLKRGDRAVMASFGAGFSGYAVLLRYD